MKNEDNNVDGKREFEELMTKLALEKGLGVENINGTYTVTTLGFKETTVSVISEVITEQMGVEEEPVTNDVDDLLPYYNDKENSEEDMLNALGSNNASDPNFLDDEMGTAEADQEIIVVDPSSSTLAPQPERSSDRQSSTVIDDETFAILV